MYVHISKHVSHISEHVLVYLNIPEQHNIIHTEQKISILIYKKRAFIQLMLFVKISLHMYIVMNIDAIYVSRIL